MGPPRDWRKVLRYARNILRFKGGETHFDENFKQRPSPNNREEVENGTNEVFESDGIIGHTIIYSALFS